MTVFYPTYNIRQISIINKVIKDYQERKIVCLYVEQRAFIQYVCVSSYHRYNTL